MAKGKKSKKQGKRKVAYRRPAPMNYKQLSIPKCSKRGPTDPPPLNKNPIIDRTLQIPISPSNTTLSSVDVISVIYTDVLSRAVPTPLDKNDFYCVINKVEAWGPTDGTAGSIEDPVSFKKQVDAGTFSRRAHYRMSFGPAKTPLFYSNEAAIVLMNIVNLAELRVSVSIDTHVDTASTFTYEHAAFARQFKRTYPAAFTKMIPAMKPTHSSRPTSATRSETPSDVVHSLQEHQRISRVTQNEYQRHVSQAYPDVQTVLMES